MKIKDFNIYKLVGETYNRKMFPFMTGDEIIRMKKVKLVRQTKPKVSMGSHVEKFIKEKNLRLVVNNGKKI
jgi:hypothetical protein|tara:strand:- start:116 stop:328 length:213 start_codon:yes stop_codon:yes gene_type:complete